MSQLQQYRASHKRPASSTVQGLPPLPAAAAASRGAGAEACHACGARFDTVGELIAHAESGHQEGWASGGLRGAAAPPGGGGGEASLQRCPHCGLRFADPVDLVVHVERQHAAELAAGASSSSCALC